MVFFSGRETMDIEIINSEEKFFQLHDEWAIVLSQHFHDNPFLSHEWMQAWWEIYGHGELYVVTCRDSLTRELVAILPLFKCRAYGVLSIRVLRFMGSEHVSSDFLDCLVKTGWEGRVYPALLTTLHGESSKVDIVELFDMDEASFFCKFLVDSNISGLTKRSDPRKCCPVLVLPDSWEDLLEELSAKKRRNVRYYRRSLEQKGTLILEKITDANQIPEAIEIMTRLRQDRMEQKKISTAQITNNYIRFHKKVLTSFLNSGRMGLYFLKLDYNTIAYVYTFTGKKGVYAYQTGFDRLMKKYSVGSVIFSMVIENSITDGYSFFEFLRGDESYKCLLYQSPGPRGGILSRMPSSA